MFLFKVFSRKRQAPVFTISEIQRALTKTDFGYTLLRHDTALAFKRGDKLVAYLELQNEGREAVLFYEYTCAPSLAAEIALEVDSVLPTFTSVVEFAVERLHESPIPDGVH